MFRTYRCDKLAVITTSSFNSRWYTLNRVEQLLFDPDLVALIENEELNKVERGIRIEDHCDEYYGERTFWGDSTDLRVTWLDVGTNFHVTYRDGWEQVIILPSDNFKVFTA